MKIRILHVIPTLDRAGAEKQMNLLVRHMDRERFQPIVCVLTRTGPLERELREAGVEIHLVGKRLRLDPAAYLRLLKVIRRTKPEVVQTWLFAGNSYGRLAARQAGVPVIIASERCVDLWKAGWQFAIDRFLAKWTNAIVVNSPAIRDFYVGHGIPAEKFVVIPNAVELPEPHPSAKREEILAELGLPADAKLIAVIGRLWPQKRIEDAIWATDLLKVVRSDVHLLVIGDGPQRDKLLRYRDQVHIADRVHFLGHREDVARLLPHIDVVWSTSGYEGQSNAILEAMAFGRPVVATDIPGTRDLIVHERTGLLFPVGDRFALARCTYRLLEDPTFAQQLGSAARNFVAEHCSVSAMVAAYQALYTRLVIKEHSSIESRAP